MCFEISPSAALKVASVFELPICGAYGAFARWRCWAVLEWRAVDFQPSWESAVGYSELNLMQSMFGPEMWEFFAAWMLPTDLCNSWVKSNGQKWGWAQGLHSLRSWTYPQWSLLLWFAIKSLSLPRLAQEKGSSLRKGEEPKPPPLAVC